LSLQSRAKVIPVDFTTRRRVDGMRARRGAARPQALAAHQSLGRAPGFLIFWRPPARREIGEYLGGRWNWGWTLFVWTEDAAVGSSWSDLVQRRGYVPRRLSREEFATFLRRAGEVEGLLLDGELDGDGHVIRAEPDQLVRRGEALSALGA
jgi:hypothetical protein